MERVSASGGSRCPPGARARVPWSARRDGHVPGAAGALLSIAVQGLRPCNPAGGGGGGAADGVGPRRALCGHRGPPGGLVRPPGGRLRLPPRPHERGGPLHARAAAPSARSAALHAWSAAPGVPSVALRVPSAAPGVPSAAPGVRSAAPGVPSAAPHAPSATFFLSNGTFGRSRSVLNALRTSHPPGAGHPVTPHMVSPKGWPCPGCCRCIAVQGLRPCNPAGVVVVMAAVVMTRPSHQ